jgi:hypothetical protein
MSEEPPNLMPLKLEEIRKEQARTNDNVGALASSIVSMRREFERAHADIQRDLASLRSSVSALVVSVDDHTRRLDKIEAHNTQLDTRLEQIEKKLDSPPASADRDIYGYAVHLAPTRDDFMMPQEKKRFGRIGTRSHLTRPSDRPQLKNLQWSGVLMACRTGGPSMRLGHMARLLPLCEQRIAAARQRARRPPRRPGAGSHGG